LLYGCDVANGELGVDFIDNLASYTGADVAASTDSTGAAGFGGNWVLEYNSGLIEASTLSPEGDNYAHLLANIDGTVDDDVLDSIAGQPDVLTGGTGDDTYNFQDNWGIDTVVENMNEGQDTLDFSAVTSDLTFTLNADGTISVTDGGGNTLISVANIEKIIGGSGTDTLVGPGAGATWNLTGDNTGIVSGFIFSDIEDLAGSAGADTFIVENKARWSGTIDGGGGSDVLDFTPVSDDLIFAIHQNNTVSVNTAPDFWASLGIIPEEVLSLLSDGLDIAEVKNVAKLVGGSADNTFAFEIQASFAGTLDGGTGVTNSLDYSAYTTPVIVDFAAGTATATGGIINMNRVVAGNSTLSVIGTVAGEETVAYSDDKGVIASLFGLVGLASIEGTTGNDTLEGNIGNNIINGKSG
ncbi:MAG: DUF4347 domain-containing protein, partial [Lysobacterales bacterium]